MPKGVAEKGYKMTQNRRNILELLVGEDGEIRSKDGKATSILHGLLNTGNSVVSLNATLRELDTLGWIHREIDGRRTYGISITTLGKEVLEVESTTGSTVTSTPATSQPVPVSPITEAEIQNTVWDWDETQGNGIDYEVLLGVFLKAAIRGMETPSNGELGYYKQQNEALMASKAQADAERDKFRAEAAKASSERDQAFSERDQANQRADQLEKNLNILMSRAEQKTSRGTDPVRKLLKPDELAALDTLMRQLPTRRAS